MQFEGQGYCNWVVCQLAIKTARKVALKLRLFRATLYKFSLQIILFNTVYYTSRFSYTMLFDIEYFM